MYIDPDAILAPAPRTDEIAIIGREPIPITLLTGFLGSGKTTLLNRILSGDHGLRVGVLVNDFGAINIDAELVEGVEENTINLANGCICCEIRDDLVRSLEELLQRADQIDYVIVEASGVSDPEGIVMTFVDKRYDKLLRIDSITCIIDAEAIFADGDNDELNMLKLRQIGFADLVVLNKVDLVSPTHVEVIREWIDQQIHRIRIVEATRCDVPLEILLAVGRFNSSATFGCPEGCEEPHHHHGHSHSKAGDLFETWSFETDRPMSIDKLRQMVKRQLPASVFRCKGIVYCSEMPNRRHVLQVVGRRTEISDISDWDGRPRNTRIIAIGAALDTNEISRLFEGCLA